MVRASCDVQREKITKKKSRNRPRNAAHTKTETNTKKPVVFAAVIARRISIASIRTSTSIATHRNSEFANNNPLSTNDETAVARRKEFHVRLRRDSCSLSGQTSDDTLGAASQNQETIHVDDLSCNALNSYDLIRLNRCFDCSPIRCVLWCLLL